MQKKWDTVRCPACHVKVPLWFPFSFLLFPERSRSRDDPMWQTRHPQQRGRQYDPRPEVPPAPRLRKVLAIVDLQSVRPLITKPMMMSWTPRPVMCYLPSAGLKNAPCSPTMSYSIPTVSNPSRCTTCFIASASTSGTRGIATYPRPPWTLGGKTTLETLSLSAMKTGLLNSFMNIILIGPKAKNSAFYFQITSDILRLTFSLISCAWAAMKPSLTATCFHETD